MFSRLWHKLHVFLRLAQVTCFPALGTGYVFSRLWHKLHDFPRLEPVACFLALGTGYMFSRACHRLHVFPRLSPVTCFPALGTRCIFMFLVSTCSLHNLRLLWLFDFDFTTTIYFFYKVRGRIYSYHRVYKRRKLYLRRCLSYIKNTTASSHSNRNNSGISIIATASPPDTWLYKKNRLSTFQTQKLNSIN